MKSTLHKLLVLCCALYLSGTHWAVLQTTAWTGMLISRSQNVSVAEAIETTFDGGHPCRMCSAIASGQKKEQENERQFPTAKKVPEVKFVEMVSVQLPAPQTTETLRWPELAQACSARHDAPATPPPRA